jgi:hypothetical protein
MNSNFDKREKHNGNADQKHSQSHDQQNPTSNQESKINTKRTHKHEDMSDAASNRKNYGGNRIVDGSFRLLGPLTPLEHWQIYRDVATIVFATVGLLLTLLILGVYWLQMGAMVRSNIAMKESVELGRRTAHFEQRPWLSFSFVPDVPLTDGKPFIQLIRVKNTGKTPAKQVNGRIVSRIFGKDEEVIFDYGHGTAIISPMILPDEFQDFPSVLLPKNIPSEGAPSPILMTLNIREQLGAGELYIVTFGRITYDDMFGGHHWVQFCAPGPNTVRQYKFHQKCIEYNDIDSNEVP